MKKEMRIKLTKKNVIVGIAFVLLIFALFAIPAYNTQFQSPAVYGHNSSEVSGAWNRILPDTGITLLQTFSHVGIGTNPVSDISLIVDGGDIKISGDGNGILFPDGNKQTTAYKRDAYCPPSVLGLNGNDVITLDPLTFGGVVYNHIGGKENIIHNGCTPLGNDKVKISNVKICETRYASCYSFKGETDDDKKNLCKLLGYGNADSASTTTVDNQDVWEVTDFNVNIGGTHGGHYIFPTRGATLAHGKGIKDITCSIGPSSTGSIVITVGS